MSLLFLISRRGSEADQSAFLVVLPMTMGQILKESHQSFRCGGSAGMLLIFCAVLAVPGFGQQDRSTDNRILFFQKKLKEDPDYYENYNRLASAYLQKARESGDLTFYELAEKTVQKSLDLESTHSAAAETLGLASAIDFAEHKFEEAADKAEKALKLDPADLGSYASAGDAYLETGEYEKARQYFAHLNSGGRFRPGLKYLELSRQASLALSLGRPEDAIAVLQPAIESGIQASLPPENIAWTQFTLGEAYLQIGELGHAESAVNESLARFPSYHRALWALARVRVSQKRYPEAIDAYKKAMAIIPLPVYAAALGDIYLKTGNPIQARKQYQLVEYIASLSYLSKTVYNRELALFYADHDIQLDHAVDLAYQESKIRHDIYTEDALSWAQYRAGKPAVALRTISKVEQYSPHDPVLLFHWGMIEDGVGNTEKSDLYLRKALALNPEFHVLFADKARGILKKHGTKNKVEGK